MPIRVDAELNVPQPGGVLIVGRDPGEQEEIDGRPFVGPAGELLDEMLAHAGWRRQDVNITNVVPYRPPNNEFSRHVYQDVVDGKKALYGLLERLQPRLVIALGNEANFTLLGEDIWPSKGRGVYGAKGIEERRGFFWSARGTTVLSALHPAAVVRKEVPGKFLLETDFRRARKFMAGELPIETFPAVRRLDHRAMLRLTRGQTLIGWDIETKWGTSAILCSGYCGDDLQPYVAVYPREFEAFGRDILTSPVPKVGHNGFGFDLPALQLFAELPVVGYAHDTQMMWSALEPEVAGTDEAGGDELEESLGESRLTRKGLAFLTTMYNMNFPWWKEYPSPDDPEYLPRMIELNGRDCYATRILASTMLQEITAKGLVEQYEQKLRLIPVLNALHVRGLPINDTLRHERLIALDARKDIGREQSRTVALAFIEEHEIALFGTLGKCRCCGGGKFQAQHCWRCAELPQQPKRKGDWPAKYVKATAAVYNVAKPTISDLRKSLPRCDPCAGTGKIRRYRFNPFSPQHQTKLLVQTLGAPKHTFRGKDTMDEAALKRILRWAQE